MFKQHPAGPSVPFSRSIRRIFHSVGLLGRNKSDVAQRFGSDNRQRKLTPEEARRDHWVMLRYISVHALCGVIIGICVGVALMFFDIGGLGSRMNRASNFVLPALLIFVPLASLFGGAAAASAIITMSYERKFDDE